MQSRDCLPWIRWGRADVDPLSRRNKPSWRHVSAQKAWRTTAQSSSPAARQKYKHRGLVNNATTPRTRKIWGNLCTAGLKNSKVYQKLYPHGKGLPQPDKIHFGEKAQIEYGPFCFQEIQISFASRDAWLSLSVTNFMRIVEKYFIYQNVTASTGANLNFCQIFVQFLYN